MARDLVIVEADLDIGLEKEQLVLRRQGQVVRRSRLQDLFQIVLMGRNELSSAAREVLLKQGIDVVFLNHKGKYLGRLSAHQSRHSPLRLAQYAHCHDRQRSLALAKSFVRGKLSNQRRLLLRQQRELQLDSLTQALAGIRRMLQQLEHSQSIEQLMGYEGQAAALYFGVFPHLIRREGFVMQGRSKRPPRDNVNACLSFGYTILTLTMETHILQNGLDPYLGYLHQIRQGLPGLVLDMVEEFRPLLVDRCILRLINREQLQAGDFYSPQDHQLAEEILAQIDSETDKQTYLELSDSVPDQRPAVYLNDTGRRIFFQAWYEQLRQTRQYDLHQRQYEWSEIIRQQVFQLARVLKGEVEHYVPFTPR